MSSWEFAWQSLDTRTRLTFLSGGASILLALGVWVAFRFRRSPEERERRRRLAVGRTGRMCEALVTDFTGCVFEYTYSVGGVSYTAAQDVSMLRELLPPNPELLVGHAYLKYNLRNPADSIVLSECWSGLRRMEEARGKEINSL